MRLHIRLATSHDAPELARLRYEFRADQGLAVEDEPAFVARCAPWMAERLAVGAPWHGWVAVAGEQIVGHLWLQLVEKIPNPGAELELHGYVTNVYVREQHRGQGAAAAMLEAALACCRGQGVDSVFLWPTERSRPLYSRHGFVDPTDMMEAVLDPGRDLDGHSHAES